jgi:WD40 repeat protein
MNLSADDWAYVNERASQFVGREWVLAQVDRFIAGPPGNLVLRGPPGCGKSAVAARLATASTDRLAACAICRPGNADVLAVAQQISDQLANSVPGFETEREATLAPEIRIGNVTVTTGPVAPGASVTGVRIVLDALGGDRAFARGVRQPLRHLADGGGADRIVVLVDGLDEATSDGATPLAALLRDLPAVHLIVTTRDDPRVLRYFEHVDVDIDLSADADDDVGAFVRAQIQGRAGDDLAASIAEEAHGNFLYARYVVDALLDSGEIDDVASLPIGGLPGVYTELVRARAPGDAELPLFRAVLAGLVVARGTGVTVEAVAGIARELLHRPVAAGDVRLMVRRVRQFLAGTDPDGPYAPYHRSFAEFLGGDDADDDWRVDTTAAHQAVVRALVSAVPVGRRGLREWERCDDYTRRHLVGHATAGRALRELMDDAGFVAAEDPSQLLPALRNDPSLAAHPNVRVYRRSGALLHGLSSVERAAQLGLEARRLGADAFADRLAAAAPGAPWMPLWSHWRVAHAHSIVGVSRVPVRGLALSSVDGLPVAVWGDDEGLLRCSDVASGEAVWPPARHADGVITAVATGWLDERPIALSGGHGGVRVWDLTTGKLRGALAGARAEQDVFAVALSFVDSGVMAIAGFLDGAIQRWDVATGAAVGEPLGGHANAVMALAVADHGDRPICVSADRGGAVITRDLATGSLLYQRMPGEDDLGFLALAAFDDDGTTTIAYAGYTETIHVRDALSGEERGPDLHGHQDMIRSLAMIDAAGRHACVSASDDETVRVWNLSGGRPTGETLRGHEGPVRTVAVRQTEDEPLVVSCGDDGTLRSWQIDLEDVGSEQRAPTLEGPLTMMSRSGAHEDELDEFAYLRFLSAQELFGARDFELNGAAVGELEGRSVAVTCGETSGVHAWDLETGERVGDPYLDDPTAHMLACVAVAQAGEHTIVLAGSESDTISAWYLPDGARLGVLPAEQDGVQSIAVRPSGPDDDALVFATGGDDGSLRLWDLVAGTGGASFQAHDGDVGWVAMDAALMASLGRDDEILRVFDSSEEIMRETDVAAAALAMIGGRHVVVFADTAGAIHAREPDRATPIHLCEASDVTSLAVGNWRARPLLVVAGERGLRIWPLGPGGAEPLAGDGITIDLRSRVADVRIGPRGTVLAAAAAGVACIRLNPKHGLA